MDSQRFACWVVSRMAMVDADPVADVVYMGEIGDDEMARGGGGEKSTVRVVCIMNEIFNQSIKAQPNNDTKNLAGRLKKQVAIRGERDKTIHHGMAPQPRDPHC